MERPKREKVLTAADLKRKAELEELKATREGKKSRLENMEVSNMGDKMTHICMLGLWRGHVGS